MEIVFTSEELADLYEGQKPKIKQWKSNPTLVKQYIKTVEKLKAATKIEELSTFGSLHYKKLRDNPDGMSAVRINDQYRLHFKEIYSDEEPPKVVLLEIRKITNHYKTN